MGENIITEIINDYLNKNSFIYTNKAKTDLKVFILNRLKKMGITIDNLDFTIEVNDELLVDIKCHNNFTMNIFRSDKISLQRYVKLNMIFGYE